MRSPGCLSRISVSSALASISDGESLDSFLIPTWIYVGSAGTQVPIWLCGMNGHAWPWLLHFEIYFSTCFPLQFFFLPLRGLLSSAPE